MLHQHLQTPNRNRQDDTKGRSRENVTQITHLVLSSDLGDILIVTKIEENIQVVVEQRLAKVQVFDAPLEDIKDRNYHLLKGTHLLVREYASNDLLHELNHLLGP